LKIPLQEKVVTICFVQRFNFVEKFLKLCWISDESAEFVF